MVWLSVAAMILAGCSTTVPGTPVASRSLINAAWESLTPLGSRGLTLGESAADITAEHPDFPSVSGSGRETVVWEDSDLDFVDGVLDSISPHDGGSLLNGVTVGTSLDDVVASYGEPVGVAVPEDGVEWLTFAADTAADSAYRIAVDPDTRQVQAVTVCRCLSRATESAEPTEMTFGNVTFTAPAGWAPTEYAGGTLTGPLVTLAPSPDSTTTISIWSLDTTQDPDSTQAAVESSGYGGYATFAGKQIWTYLVSHTVSSRGPGDYLLKWIYLFQGPTRVDVACDALEDDAAQTEMMAVCEQVVASIVVS